MSEQSVLYDAPGPVARRRAIVGSIVAGVIVLGLLAVVVVRLASQGQFDQELYAPLFDPSTEEFPLVWDLLGDGLVATLRAAGLAIVFSIVIGLALGVTRMLLGRWSRMPIVGLIELLRGLPVVITIYFASKVLPEIGLDVGPLPGGDGLWYLVIGLTAYNSVIIAEIVRAGVASLPRGQAEAGLAIGLTPAGTMTAILMPQAIRVMLPALISQIVVILKDTSLAAVLGLYTELLRQGNLIALNLDNPIQVLALVGTMFVLLNLALGRVATLVERRLGRRTSGTHVDTGALVTAAGGVTK